MNIAAQGRSVSPAGRRERTLLALLLISLNQVVASERLVDELWPAHPPKEALHSLRVAVSRLRKALGELSGADLVVTQTPGYVIQSAPETLDLACFEALVARARAEVAGKEHRQAGETLRQALSLWRGRPLADVAETPLVRSEIARLEEARLAAVEARVEADLAVGRHAELIAELEALTRSHPLREALWGHRMLAFYRSGRQAEALRAYQELRRILGEELGIAPSAPLVELEHAILRQDPGLAWRAEATPAGASRAEACPSPTAPRLSVGRPSGPSLAACWSAPPPGKADSSSSAASPASGSPAWWTSSSARQWPGCSGWWVGHCYESGRNSALHAVGGADRGGHGRHRSGRSSAGRWATRPRSSPGWSPNCAGCCPTSRRRWNCLRNSSAATRSTASGSTSPGPATSQPRLFVLEDLHWADESDPAAPRAPGGTTGEHPLPRRWDPPGARPTDITSVLAETVEQPRPPPPGALG